VRIVFFQALLLTLVLTLALFGIVWLVQRRQRRSTVKTDHRKTGEKRTRRAIAYIARLTGFALMTVLAVSGAVMAYISYQSVVDDTAPAPSRVELPPDLPFEVSEVSFPGGDGLRLAGWFVPPQNGATVILLHGYGGNRTTMLWNASVLVKAGYGVLLYDERASGESEGDHRSYGWEDPADVGGALDYLTSLPEIQADRIGIAGCSIGGQIALQGAAYYPQIGAVWADGPATVTSRDIPAPFNWATALAIPSNWMMDWMMSARIDRPIPPAMIDIIGTIEPRPVLLVAGNVPHPHYGPESLHVEYMARFAGAHTKLWIIPEVRHCDGPVQRPEEYAERLVAFFDEAFGISR
jgi:pimeloyl-ACP methyl ester carboxylesterase